MRNRRELISKYAVQRSRDDCIRDGWRSHFGRRATTTYAAANNLNQYPTIGCAGATYDANGNIATYNGWTYTHDSMNRLTLASASGTTASYYDDGLNRPASRGNGFGLSQNDA